MKPGHIIGAAVIASFAVLGGSSFKKSLTPYVGFAEAEQSGRTVQVRGARVPGTDHFDEKTQAFLFDVVDEAGQKMPVVYHGIKPGNFEQAKELVVIGKFQGGAFHSGRLLVKCPSKYQAKKEAGETAPH